MGMRQEPLYEKYYFVDFIMDGSTTVYGVILSSLQSVFSPRECRQVCRRPLTAIRIVACVASVRREWLTIYSLLKTSLDLAPLRVNRKRFSAQL